MPQLSENEKKSRVFIIVPAFNEARVIEKTLQPLIAAGYTVVVVDDGSSDNTCDSIRNLPVYLLRHPINLGQGAATQTGMVFAVQNGARFIVFFDADGQHQAEDIPALLEPLEKNTADVVIGSRFLEKEHIKAVPPLKRIVLRTAVIVNGLMTGMWLSDAHNGFRTITREAAEHIDLKENGYAHSSEFLIQIRSLKLRYAEKPTRIIYTDYSKAKGQSIWNAFNVVIDLILRRIFK